jgi:regulatory protein
MAVTHDHGRRARPPLDGSALERIALAYAGRYATTRARLADFLTRKLRERGWDGPGDPPIQSLVDRMSALNYVDDRAFATAKAASLSRRGYGERRIGDALRAAGIDAEDAADARNAARDGAWTAALRFAERRRIGPFASAEPDRPAREKAYAAMLRAGHRADLANRILAARPGEIPEPDGC